MKLSKNSISILEKRYLLKDDSGKIIETPEQMIDRVCNYVCDDVELRQKAKQLMLALKFLPNTPTLMNAGITNQLSACYVLPIDDSLESIVHDTLWQQASIHKMGGGVGINFSNLRPVGDPIKTTGGVTTGVLSFVKNFDTMSGSIHQGGKRDGANMTILSCLDGNSLIHTTEGKIPIKNLVGKHPYVYSCDTETKKIHIIKADNVFISGNNREIIRVWLDNDNYIDCTEDHRFLLSNCEYKQANDLKLGDSLMAFKKVLGGTHNTDIIIGCTNGYSRKEQDVVAEDILNVNVDYTTFIHHKDENHQNNNPENLEVVTRSTHQYFHLDGLYEGTKKLAEFRKGKTLEEIYGEDKAKQIKEKQSSARQNIKPWNENLIGEEYKEHYKNGFKNQYENHKVIRIEKMGNVNDVYDISLPKYHNFVVNGIFVHNCYHPEIENFITIKTQNKKDYENMNFSVLVDDNFMKAVIDDKEINLSFPIKTDNIRKKVKAKYLWNLICDSAHKCGCPGILFEDTINKSNILKEYMWMTTTNPCGEQILYCGKVINIPKLNGKKIAESCNLGSMNLPAFVDENGIFKFEELREAVFTAVEFLDCVIDKNNYPFDFIEEGTKLTRKIGLGVTGFHEMLVKMRMPYGSDESVKCAEKVMSFINESSNESSKKIAEKKGVYPLAYLVSDKRRNATTTTIAPTGTIGRFMLGYGHALGIEPPFAINIESKIIETTLSDGIYPPLLEVLRSQGWRESTIEQLIYNIKRNGNSIQNLEIPDKIKILFRTANEIPIEEHIAVQSAFQCHTQNAVSKTINLNNKSTIEDVSKAFNLAYKSGLKGITIYRDGSKDKQVLNVIKDRYSEMESIGGKKPFLEEEVDTYKREPKNIPTPRPRFKDHIAIIREIESGCGVTYSGISFDKYGLFEVFPINSGKGGCIASQEAIGRSGSTMLRFNIPVETIIKQFGRVKCNNCLTKDEFYDKDKKFIGIKSCSHGLSKQMNDYYSNSELVSEMIELQNKIHLLFNQNGVNDGLMKDYNKNKPKEIQSDNIKYCPDCKVPLIKQEGCSSDGCPNCGIGGCS